MTYIKAERDGDWLLHLVSFQNMISYYLISCQPCQLCRIWLVLLDVNGETSPMISVFFWRDNTWHDTFVEYGMVFGVTSSSNPTLWDLGTALAGLLDLHSRLKLWRSGHWVATFVARWSRTWHTSRCQRSGWSPSEARLVHGSYGPRGTSRR